MNTHIVDQFSLLVKQINAEYLNAEMENNKGEMARHRFRLQQIKKALSIIKKLDFKITNANDVDGIQGIGSGTKRRIAEILEKGSLSELKNKYGVRKQKKIDSIIELTKVIGIGDKLAEKLVKDHHIIDVNDLKKRIKIGKIEVNDKVKLGLKYYGVVKGNIPRNEISEVEKVLNEIAHKINPDLHVVICGSYRRQKETSNDIDVLIYHPRIKNDVINVKGKKSYLELLVTQLTNLGYLVDHMTDKNFKKKYMGFFKYNDYDVRRMDIKFIAANELPSALLSYTGPLELNTYMRKEAQKRGLFLNEYGLYIVEDDDSHTPIDVTSERDIFERLGMKYLSPKQREKFSSGKIKKVH